MNTAMPAQQRGITFGGFIFGIFLLVLLGIFGLKLVPAYMENAKIKDAFVDIAHDPTLQNGTEHDIRESFEKHASVDSITAIKGGDIDVSADGTTPVLSASYAVKIPLIANVSLYLDFNPSSAK